MYELEKVGRGYYVVNIVSRKRYSIKPMTKKAAKAQLRILEAAMESEEVPTLNIVEMIKEPLKGGEWNPFVVTRDNGPTQEQVSSEFDTAMTVLGFVPGLGAASTIASLATTILPMIPGFKKEETVITPRTLTAEETVIAMANAQQEADKRIKAAQQNYGVYIPKHQLSDQELLSTLKSYNTQSIVEAQARQKFDLQNKTLQSKLNAERQVANQTAINLQRQQYQSGLNTQSAAVQRSVTSINEAVKKAKILQAQKIADQQLFVTKVADINRKNFFDKERVDQEAKQALLNAERRRQAIKASVASASAPAPANATATGMVPTLGRPLNLPPSVLWFGSH